MNCREPIQQRIRDLGLTQRAVSHAMGVTDQSLSNFLNGSRTYSYLAYVKLLKVLGITLGHEGDNIGTAPALSVRRIIKAEIEKRGQPLSEIAKRCDVRGSTLSSFLTGRRGIRINSLERIITELGLTYVSFGEPTI